MKKFLWVAALFLVGIAANAQRVAYDNTDMSGVRTVILEGLHLGAVNGVDVYAGLAGFQYNKTIRYSLAVSYGSDHKIEVPTGSNCLISLPKGKTISLPSVAGGAAVLQDIDVQLEDVYQSFRRFAYYRFNKNGDLKKAIKKGVEVLDFQLSPADYVVSFNANEFGSLLENSFNTIQQMFGK